MPIEVRELIIKTTIVEKSLPDTGQQKQTLSKKEIERLKREIINSCKEEIIDTINREKER